MKQTAVAPPPLAAAPPPAGPVRLLVCGPQNAGAGKVDPIASLGAGGGWRHGRIEASYARLPADPDDAFARVMLELDETGASGVLLLSLPEASGADAGFVVSLRARNRRSRGRGGRGGGRRIAPTGPASVRATAPVADLVRALVGEGLGALASSDPTDDDANHLLYRLLTEAAAEAGAPAVGALHLPAEPEQDAAATVRGLRAALLAFADPLGPAAVPARRPAT